MSETAGKNAVAVAQAVRDQLRVSIGTSVPRIVSNGIQYNR